LEYVQVDGALDTEGLLFNHEACRNEYWLRWSWSVIL